MTRCSGNRVRLGESLFPEILENPTTYKQGRYHSDSNECNPHASRAELHSPEDVLADRSEPIGAVLRLLSEAGVPTIPVLGVDRVAEYFDVVHNWALDNGGDIGIRLTSFDLGNGSPVESLLSRLRVPIDRLHLIMDYGSLPPALFGPLKVAAPMQLSQLPRLKEWKTFTVAASGFPANLSDVNQYSMDEFTRTEWLLWRHLQSERERIERLPAFGDYAVSHPELLEFDPRKMRTSPKIKYTDDLRWLVAKGESFRRKSDTKKPQHAPAKEQYQRLAKMITGHDAWREANFSWGDRQIDAAAAGNGRSDATTWVTVGTVHHIVFVVRQIASLHEF